MAQLVACLSSLHKDLGLNPSIVNWPLCYMPRGKIKNSMLSLAT